MAKVRIGFSTHFEVENELVGIGTDNPTNTKQVLGNIHATNAKAVGITTLTTPFDGFTDTKLSLQGSAGAKQHTTSGEIIIEGEITVSSGTTFTSGPENLIVTDSFTLPGISDDKPSVGTTRFNEHLGALEFYTGVEWKAVNSYVDSGNRGRVIFMGGTLDYPNTTCTDIISYIQLSTLGNAQDFGILTSANDQTSCCSSSIRGFRMGGNRPETDTIDYVTIASEGDAVDFGNLQSSKMGGGGCSSSTRGFYCGGFDNPADTNIIDYFEMNTLGNSLDFGDLTLARRYGSSFSSPTRGFYTSGSPGGRGIDVFTMASKGNATKFGDTAGRAQQMGGFANTTRAIYGIEQSRDAGAGLEYITMASEGNAINFGELGRATAAELGNGCNHVRGVLAGGFATPAITNVNNIEYITIAALGNAQDFGDLTTATSLFKGCSDSHGGLGGF